jgi:hypothetical protein
MLHPVEAREREIMTIIGTAVLLGDNVLDVEGCKR